jgi:hypothetical protein
MKVSGSHSGAVTTSPANAAGSTRIYPGFDRALSCFFVFGLKTVRSGGQIFSTTLLVMHPLIAALTSINRSRAAHLFIPHRSPGSHGSIIDKTNVLID